MIRRMRRSTAAWEMLGSSSLSDSCLPLDASGAAVVFWGLGTAVAARLGALGNTGLWVLGGWPGALGNAGSWVLGTMVTGGHALWACLALRSLLGKGLWATRVLGYLVVRSLAAWATGTPGYLVQRLLVGQGLWATRAVGYLAPRLLLGQILLATRALGGSVVAA